LITPTCRFVAASRSDTMRIQTLAVTRSLLIAALCGLFLVSCGSGVKVRSDFDPSVDMRVYRTYDFFSQMGIEQTSYPNLLGQHFREAISGQMDSRGFRKSAAPHLQVNVTIDTENKVRVNTYQDPYLYGGYYGGYRGVGWGSPMYYGGGTTTTVRQYTEANVYIDLVDTAKHRMIWQGVATFTITDKMQERVRESVYNTVAEVFTQFPVAAQSAQ